VIAREEITGVILCGGEGSRMKGVNKPLLALHGRPLVEHVRERLAPQVHQMLISANREPVQYAAWGDVVIADVTTGSGPLAGLSRALSLSITPYLFCCPGDAPRLNESLVPRLAAALEGAAADLAYPHDGERSQHLFLLLRVTPSLVESLNARLAAGLYSVRDWIQSLKAAEVDASDISASFANINTTADLQRVAACTHTPPQLHSTPEHL
jgi:molybdopterin-guanine dinucleotide biosynthesis protein A